MFLRTLGQFGLFDGEGESPSSRIMGPAKPLALLVYLAMAPRRRASRERLVALLWSDAEPDRARSTLRQTMWSLRQKLGDDALRTDGDDLVLDLPVIVDAERFEQAVAAGDLEAAWTMYAGPFIPDVGFAGGAGFERWADLERDRVRAAWLAAGTTLAQRALTAQRFRVATDIARRLLDQSPERLDLWAIRLESLLADGDRVAAMADAESLRVLLLEEGLRPDAPLRSLLDRIHRAPEPAAPATGPRRPDLVGREFAFAELLQAWKAATRGTGSTCVLRGAAGLGKTRLLLEFRRRLLDLGATVVLVRARPVDRDVPYSLVASIAEALADCPGAAGVASATASVLVDLVPTLSNAFPRAERLRVDAEDVLRSRILAITELLHVVAEEAPVVLMVDDLHWADEFSQRLLSSLSERVGASTVLLVLSLRPSRGVMTLPRGAVAIDVPPLNGEQLEQLVASMAEADPVLIAALGVVLLQASVGVPLLAIVAIDLALEQRWVAIDGDHWSCPDIDRLRRELARGSVLERLLQELPDDGLSILVACALAQRAVSSDVLGTLFDRRSLDAITTALELRGLLVHAGDAWDLSHDSLADAALDIATTDKRRDIARRLGHALLREREPSMRALQLAGRLLTTDADDEALRCFRRWLHLSARRRYWRDPLLAASAFLGDDATVEQARRLQRSVSPVARLVNGYPVVAAVLAMLAIGIGGGGVVVQAQRWLEPRATHMMLTEPPTSRRFLWDTTAKWTGWTTDSIRNPLPIRVSFRDAAGSPARRAPSRVRVQLVDVTGAPRLEGASERQVTDGEADFADLVVRGWGSFRVRAEGSAMPPVQSARFYATGADVNLEAAHVVLAGGTVNGQVIDSSRRVIQVHPGEELRGQLRLRTLTDMRAASLLLGAVATWGDRRTNWLRLRALPSHGDEAFEIPLSDRSFGNTLRAPVTPGTYRILLVQDAETEMKYVASRTSWMLEQPVWNDGDDVADLDSAAIARLDATGRTPWPKLRAADDGSGRRLHASGYVIGTTLTVIVR